MSQLKPNEYQCALCKHIYTKAMSDKEAMAETRFYWPGVDQQDCGVVCDDCWQKIRPHYLPHQARRAKSSRRARKARQNSRWNH